VRGISALSCGQPSQLAPAMLQSETGGPVFVAYRTQVTDPCTSRRTSRSHAALQKFHCKGTLTYRMRAPNSEEASVPAVIAQPDRVSAPVESPPSATGGPRSNSGRTFDIAPERRDAMLLSAALWTGACGLLGVGAVLAGNIENLGEYLT